MDLRGLGELRLDLRELRLNLRDGGIELRDLRLQRSDGGLKLRLRHERGDGGLELRLRHERRDGSVELFLRGDLLHSSLNSLKRRQQLVRGLCHAGRQGTTGPGSEAWSRSARSTVARRVNRSDALTAQQQAGSDK